MGKISQVFGVAVFVGVLCTLYLPSQVDAVGKDVKTKDAESPQSIPFMDSFMKLIGLGGTGGKSNSEAEGKAKEVEEAVHKKTKKKKGSKKESSSEEDDSDSDSDSDE